MFFLGLSKLTLYREVSYEINKQTYQIDKLLKPFWGI